MGFYNVKYILKLCLKFVSALSFLLLITLCFFLIFTNSNSVSAETLIANGSAFQEYECQNFQNYYEQNMASTYDYYCAVLRAGDSYAYINFFNATTDFNVRWTTENNGFIRSWPNTAISNGVWYSVQVRSLNDATYTYQGNFSGALSNWCTRIGTSPNYQYYFFGNIPLYDGANNLVWQPIQPTEPFVPPALYPNANSNQTPLTSGNFTFFIIKPNSVPITESIQLDFADMSSDNNGDFIVQEITLNRDSPFFEFTNIDETEYQYVITARFLNWFKLINGKSYRAILAYFDENHIYHDIIYDWTMSIDSSQQQIIEDTTQQDINQGIQDMNSFMRDDNYSQDGIISSMPNSDSYSDPAERWFTYYFYCFTKCIYF